MEFPAWETKVKQLKTNTSVLGVANLTLVGLLTLSLGANFFSKPVVVVHPMIAPSSLEIRANTLTKSYAVSFGLSMALLLGNVTSDNATHVLESISNYVVSNYYAEFRKQLVADIVKLRENRVDMSFTATNSYLDEASGEVIVDGIATLTDAAGLTTRSKHQYRFTLQMDEYVPRILAMSSTNYD